MNTPRKKIDSRIRTVVENNVKLRHRTFFVIVGDKAREQVMNLHYMLTKSRVKSRPNVLWCYKKELGFIGDTRARAARLAKKKKKENNQSNTQEEDLNDPFHLFLAATDVRFCYFKETQNILGSTYGMLVLQDFEAITPNILARTIETVEGGGMIVLLLPSMTSLKQLYTMTMDVHQRFRTNDEHDITPRFNERFLLSLASCHSCLVLDDQLNILPLSSYIKDIKPVVLDDEERSQNHIVSAKEKELLALRESLQDTQPVGTLVDQARTLDQAKGILQFISAISEKTLQTTVALTAARGRGKSAALGIAIAAAIAYGYSNIFVTSPSPENLKTLFEFIFKGFDALKYKDQVDYEIVQSTNPAFNKAIVRVNIFREHRQTIQYIQPQDYQKLGQAELLVIDEAAAIPLPIVKKLLGPYLVYISSTINGYEGTGRSLSLKLIQELREKSSQSTNKSGRKFYEIKLEEPIRYGENDHVEKWLYDVLCLGATTATQITNKCPHPSDCSLYYVNRDTLFSYNPASEAFLHNMMSLYVASHYKNTPNDLQIMSDAPNHHLFVLLGPIDENTTTLPDIYTVIQVGLEGNINKETVVANLIRGQSPTGDLIPYLISRQYQETDFGTLSGARIVRIATHPDYIGTGYGQRAMELLTKYYEGDLQSLEEEEEEEEKDQADGKDEQSSNDVGLDKELIVPRDRSKLPPLLQKLEDRKPEPIQYLGVSYGMTQKLFQFWKKCHFKPLYVRLSQNDLTGEHTCVMLKSLKVSSKTTQDWLDSFYQDFKRRFITLLAYEFSEFSPSLTLSVLDFQAQRESTTTFLTLQAMDDQISQYDLKRLNSYARNLVDYHVVMDLLPTLARWYFVDKIPFSLTYAQAAILAGLGLQHKKLEQMEKDLNLQSNQLLALFNKAMCKFVKFLREVEKQRSVINTKDNKKKTSSLIVKSIKSNVMTEELEEKSDEEEENKMQDNNEENDNDASNNLENNEEIMSLFEKPLENDDDELLEMNKKKRKASEIDNDDDSEQDDEEEEDVEQRTADLMKFAQREKGHKKNPLIKEVIKNDEYKITGITNADLEKGLEESTDGIVRLETSLDKKKEIKKYMLKSKKEQEASKKFMDDKVFKKGGKKKRRVKK